MMKFFNGQRQIKTLRKTRKETPNLPKIKSLVFFNNVTIINTYLHN